VTNNDETLPPSPQAIRPRRFPFWLTGVILAAVVLLVYLFVPTRHDGSHPNLLIDHCRANLRQIGQACQLYLNDYHSQYPPTLDVLLANEDLTADIAVCPSTDTPRPDRFTTSPTTAPLTTDYAYLGAGLDSTTPADVIIAHDRLANHASEGLIQILYADGHVDRINLADFPAALTTANATRKQWEASHSKPVHP